jgi:peptidoglycan/xylan/chitin deacetylase (PgdA/CDA1 family)
LLALRIDDIGASSKRYEVYSDSLWGNWLFLKYLPPFKKWGPYREMRAKEWYEIYDLLKRYHAKLTVAVTATWAKSENQVIPFPIRFPEEARALREGVREGLIEIANHGLTHCVLKNNAFKPKWFSANRLYHREFWDWIPREIQEEHIRRSQEILQNWFATEIVTFVPPGSVFTDDTLEIAQQYGLRYVSCNTQSRILDRMVIVGDEDVVLFHDRDFVLNGVGWLREKVKSQRNKQFCFIWELGERLLTSTQTRLHKS